jgi:hypothetical protein|tara:strand:- start:1075 stop:1284 length:210 start_codon:yes stop_codon:yes gene_type:complete
MRLSFDISDEAWDTLSSTLKHGSRKYIYAHIMEGFARRLRKDHKRTLALIVTDLWDLKDVLEEPETVSE